MPKTRVSVPFTATICDDPDCSDCRAGALLGLASAMEATVPPVANTPDVRYRNAGLLLLTGLFSLRMGGHPASVRSVLVKAMDTLAQAKVHEIEESEIAEAGKAVDGLFASIFGARK